MRRTDTKKRLTKVRLAAMVAVLLGLPLGLLTVGPATARAATAPSYSQVKISVWPEYDDPRVLVIMEPVLADSVKLPVRVSYLIPKGAKVNMACEITESGGHNCRPQELTSKGKHDQVSYTVTKRRTLFFEYYYDAFGAAKGPQKRFTFNYIPTYRVEGLTMEVQQPLKATGFTLNPPSTKTASDKKGFTYYQYSYSSLPVNKPVSLTVSYDKTDPNPSVEKTVGQGGGGNGQQAQGSTGTNAGDWGSVLGVVGVVALLGTIAYWMLPLGRNRTAKATAKSATAARQRQGKKRAKGSGPNKKPSPVAFCSKCGSKVSRTDHFCAVCGREVA